MKKTSKPEEALMSGVLWTEMKNYIIKAKGDDMLEKIADAGSPDLKMFLTSTILVLSNTPASYIREFYDLWKIHWPDPTGERLIRMIRWVASQNLSTLMTIFFKFGSPLFIVKRFPSIWDHFFNYGTLSLLAVADKQVDFQVTGTEVYGEGVCKGTTGWAQGALRQSGAEKIEILHSECIFHSNARCFFRCTWK